MHDGGRGCVWMGSEIALPLLESGREGGWMGKKSDME